MGLIRGLLNNLIKNKKNISNKVDEDIAALNQGIENATKASQLFKESASEMTGLRKEVEVIFQGEAAGEFDTKLLIYSNVCETRAGQLESLVRGYKKQISSLEDQKRKAEKTISNIESLLEKLKIFGI